MHDLVDGLLEYRFFRDIGREAVEASARYWTKCILQAGDILWREDDPATSMALILSGRLSVRVGGVDVGEATAGEMIGEVSAFIAGARRSAEVIAASRVEVLVLTVESLRVLRRRENDVYPALLEQALVTLARRVRKVDVEIAKLTPGRRPAPVRMEPSLLVRWWKALRPAPAPDPQPLLEPLLRKRPGLSLLSEPDFERLVSAFEPRWFEEGEIIFLEGERGECAYLIGSGEVDVLRHVRGERAELLAKLTVGDAFGINTLVEPGTRSASCVAVAGSWLYRMDADRYHQLSGTVRRVWQEHMITALTAQIRGANAALLRVREARKGGTPDSDHASPDSRDVFSRLLQASGYVESLPGSEHELEKIRFVLDDDQKRRLAKKKS